MRSRAVLFALSILVIDPAAALAQGTGVRSRKGSEKSTSTSGVTNTRDFADHFGLPMAKRLLESTDSATRLRGIERAAALGTPDAVVLLTKFAESASLGRGDAREAIQVVRALAAFADQAPVRKVLAAFVVSPTMGGVVQFPGRSLTLFESGDPSARFELARQTAALAIAQSSDVADLLRIAQNDGVAGEAARHALRAMHLPPSFAFLPSAFTRAATIELAGDLGDTRVAPLLRNAHPAESIAHAAVIEALAELGDVAALAMAREALADKSPRVRVAGAHALAMFDAPERYKAVAAVIDDDATLDAGVVLAQQTQNEIIVKELAQRLATATSVELRRAILVTLGRGDSLDALRVLAAFVKDPDIGADAAHAIAVSPSRAALTVIEKMIADKSTLRLGVRAYVVRAASTGESSGAASDAIDALAKSRDGSSRALGFFGQLALGRGDLDRALGDSDPRVRRAAASATLDDRYANRRKILLDRLPGEHDEGARELAAIGLLDAGARDRMPTLALVDRSTAGGADAPLATLARASRKTEGDDVIVDAALASSDPVLRAHAAIGLGQSSAPDKTGMLAVAYAYEAEPSVRRAIVTAIAGASPADSVSRLATLRLAGKLDPDPITRATAVRALRLLPVVPVRSATTMAWIHLDTADGTKSPSAMLGQVLRSDGLAVPIAFDDDGFALVPSMPPGEARLVLAPRLPTDKDAAR